MNSIKITGNITKDPETVSPQGSEYSVLKFAIANNDESKKVNGKYEDIVSFFDIEYWTKNVQYWIQKITKGARVTIQGRLKQERWEKDGNSRSRIKIIANVAMNEGFAIEVHPKVQKEQEPEVHYASAPASAQFEDEDDIPF